MLVMEESNKVVQMPQNEPAPQPVQPTPEQLDEQQKLLSEMRQKMIAQLNEEIEIFELDLRKHSIFLELGRVLKEKADYQDILNNFYNPVQPTLEDEQEEIGFDVEKEDKPTKKDVKEKVAKE